MSRAVPFLPSSHSQCRRPTPRAEARRGTALRSTSSHNWVRRVAALVRAAAITAAASVTFAKPDAYSLGISSSLDGVGAADPASVSGKLQLKLPLR